MTDTQATISRRIALGTIMRTLWAEYSSVFAFLLLFIVASIATPRFLTLQNLINIFRQVSIIGIVAMGMTVVIISGGIDLSVGSVLALSGVAGMSVLNATMSIPLAVLATIGCGMTAGLLNGLMVTKGRVAPFIATLGMMAVARSLALFFIQGGNVVGNVHAYTLIARGEIVGLRFPIFYFVIVTIAVQVIMRRTRFGRYVYATGSNEKATLLSAINVDWVKIGVYVLAGTLVALAAIVESSTLNSISSANSGNLYELDAIATVVIGGTRLQGGKGHILGTFFGVLLLGVLNNFLNLMNVSPFLEGFVKGLIIVVAVLIQRKR